MTEQAEQHPLQQLHSFEQMPRWQSHKVVRAAKIISAERETGNLVIDIDGTPFRLYPQAGFYARGTPAPGDYYVVYDVGSAKLWQSWSPALAFEEGYTAL